MRSRRPDLAALRARPARGAVVVGMAAPLLVIGLSAPAAAGVYDRTTVPGDLVLAAGDSIIGDLTVTGTLTVPSGVVVTVHSPVTVTITAAHIVIAGTLDGTGGGGAGGTGQDAAGGPGAGGPGASAQAACGGGGGAGAAATGGSGGSGGAVAGGGPPGRAYGAGPGSGGGAGGACGVQPGASGGAGGAGIHLSAGDIRISGSVRADGTHGASAGPGPTGVSGGGGGGGSGGEIWLSGTTVLPGALTALGGEGGSASGPAAGGGGGGSGGRIHIDTGSIIGEPGWSVLANQDVVSAGGGSGPNGQPGSPGGKGTVPEVTAPTSTMTAVSSSLDPSDAGQPVTFTATVTPGDAQGTVSFAADGGTMAGCSAVPVAAGSASCTTSALVTGEHAVTATFAPSSPAYGTSTGSLDPPQSVRPALLPQTITFPEQPDHVVGEAPFVLTGFAGGASGNPVLFAASGPCTVTNTVVTLTGVGTCTVTADQAGSIGYLAAPSVSRAFAVGYGQQVVSLSASGRRGGLLAVVLRLTDSGGRNLSSASVPVHVTALDGAPPSVVSGGDQRADFSYLPPLRAYAFGAYLRSGPARGPHTLTFVAGLDPRPHTVVFTTY